MKARKAVAANWNRNTLHWTIHRYTDGWLAKLKPHCLKKWGSRRQAYSWPQYLWTELAYILFLIYLCLVGDHWMIQGNGRSSCPLENRLELASLVAGRTTWRRWTPPSIRGRHRIENSDVPPGKFRTVRVNDGGRRPTRCMPPLPPR
jgi:hypothetical protein